MNKTIKSILALILLSVVMCASGCADAAKQAEVDAYNEHTEKTITDYETLSALVKGKESEIILGIADGTLNEEWCSENLDYTDATLLLNKNADSLITKEPLIHECGLFTSLGANSVTQVIRFNYKGNNFIADILWSDAKIDTILLEEKAQ